MFQMDGDIVFVCFCFQNEMYCCQTCFQTIIFRLHAKNGFDFRFTKTVPPDFERRRDGEFPLQQPPQNWTASSPLKHGWDFGSRSRLLNLVTFQGQTQSWKKLQVGTIWRIIPISKWLITMVSCCSQDLGLWDPFQMAFSWLINVGWSQPPTNWDDPSSSGYPRSTQWDQYIYLHEWLILMGSM